MNNAIFKTGIDVGSTTLKIIVLDNENNIIYKNYVRHKADINGTLIAELEACKGAISKGAINRAPTEPQLSINITGSAGMGVAERTQIPFIQEVIAAIEVIKTHYPDTHTLIDLGGEDAKIVFFEDGKQPDIRMNGSCAGGTGAFIDQMADLMNIAVADLGTIARDYKKIYPIASRCGVFAKTDVQNLISRNIPQADLAMSILQTVALQAVTTLVRGNRVAPKIICTGGPLTFIPALRAAFANVLQLPENEMFLPENSEFFPAWGCALLN
ncbi:MAG: hypothetical protein LBN95_10765 [Prevotellaceae bacterium]|jgi:predicted CoA-substrate-specific enzyme activase|nr:hypothetical protein [Prevotellaceae bacterium]